MSSILVIGARGNVGSRLVPKLIDAGHSVRTASRNPEPPVAGASHVVFDFDDRATWAPAVAGVERMFLIAPAADPEAEVRLIPFVDVAIAKGVRRIVLMTALGIDAAEDTALRKVERHLESCAADAKLEYAFLRPNWFLQNFAPGFLHASIQHAGALFLPAADAKVSFIDANDIAAVAAAVLGQEQHENRGYALTGPAAWDHHQVAAAISDVAGRDIQYIAVQDDDLRKALSEQGWAAGQVELMVGLFGNMRAGYGAVVTEDVQAVLGRPATGLHAFVRENAEAWR